MSSYFLIASSTNSFDVSPQYWVLEHCPNSKVLVVVEDYIYEIIMTDKRKGRDYSFCARVVL